MKHRPYLTHLAVVLAAGVVTLSAAANGLLDNTNAAANLAKRSKTTTSAPSVTTNTCRTANWFAEYFSNDNLQGNPVVATCEVDTPNYNWNGSPKPGIPADGFSVRWTSTKSFNAEPITFTTVSDDGVRLYVDGTMVINNWTQHPATTDTATVNMTGGNHTLVLEFFDAASAAVIQLSWGPPAPQITSFTATPGTISVGGSSTLAWTTQYTTSCAASGGWTGTKPISGSQVVQPTATTSYVLTCQNSAAQTVVAIATVNVPGGVTSRWVSGYYAGYFWDVMGSNGNPTTAVNLVDMSTMTHFIFARYSPGAGIFGGNPGDLIPTAGTGHQFVETPLINKAHANNIKALMMVGGQGDGPGFDLSTATTAARTSFVNNIVAKMAEKDYDGVDIDWEENLDTTQQRNQVLSFLNELRTAANANAHFQPPHAPVIITWPAFWTTINYPTITPWHAQVAALVDQYNIMTYSMAGDWPGWQSWHHSPLDGAGASYPTSIVASINEYVNAGVPRSKLGIGIGLYGIYYGPNVTGPRQDIGTAGVQGSDIENNYQQLILDGAFNQASGTYHWDDVAKQGYMSYSPAWVRYANNPPQIPTPITYLSFENEQSIAAKGQWVRDQGLGGTLVWTINYGYVPSLGQNPMMTAVKNAFLTPATNTASTAESKTSTSGSLSTSTTGSSTKKVVYCTGTVKGKRVPAGCVEQSKKK